MNKKQLSNPDFKVQQDASGTTFCIENVQEREVLLRFLSLMVNVQPDIQFVQNIKNFDLKGISESFDNEDPTSKISLGVTEISDFLNETSHQKEEEVVSNLAVDWNRLFRGVSPGFGPTPPYEGLYLEDSANGSELLMQLIRIYNQAFLSNSKFKPDRPDYLGIELEFLKHLAEKEIAAWKALEPDAIQRDSILFKIFFEEHPKRWVNKYCNAALSASNTKFYQGVIHILEGTIVFCSNSISTK